VGRRRPLRSPSGGCCRGGAGRSRLVIGWQTALSSACAPR
jgi:hypothetical protein